MTQTQARTTSSVFSLLGPLPDLDAVKAANNTQADPITRSVFSPIDPLPDFDKVKAANGTWVESSSPYFPTLGPPRLLLFSSSSSLNSNLGREARAPHHLPCSSSSFASPSTSLTQRATQTPLRTPPC